MLVADLMRTNVRTIGTSSTLADAVAAMLDNEVSALPVLSEHGKPLGVVTNREILAATLGGAGEGGPRGPDMIPIVEFMAPWPPAVEQDTAVNDAARMMSYLDLKRLFVMKGETLVGILSQTDIVDALATAKYATPV